MGIQGQTRAKGSRKRLGPMICPGELAKTDDRTKAAERSDGEEKSLCR